MIVTYILELRGKTTEYVSKRDAYFTAKATKPRPAFLWELEDDVTILDKKSKDGGVKIGSITRKLRHYNDEIK
jgi:hypothetical protein